ncbi:zf-DHHC-domain-containing protein [Hypomontagnella monticulosa]|nr:zf-DHHC-domain-containing protein [Hypomontagnella monticulosa]
MAFLVGSTEPFLQRLAVPAVCILIAFLAYTSQWLFANAPDLTPGPLTTAETYTFNTLVLCLWYTYYKACTVDPGRYVFPTSITKREKKKQPRDGAVDSAEESDSQKAGTLAGRGQLRRWCKKCAAPKPPRAHHCKTCRRCIPRMDHHCPWTGNCVSLQTYPHFIRFLVFTNVSLWTLLSFLMQRFLALWDARHLPAYLGPTLFQLAFLTVLTIVTGFTSLALGILLVTTLKGWVFNTTMIESWEIERHEAALERRYTSSSDNDMDTGSWWASGERAPGGDTNAPHLSLEPVEFPYDIGIFANMAAGMGTRNFLLWFFPFAGNPVVAPYPYSSTTTATAAADGSASTPKTTGWEYEENGLNDRESMWPPPDPDKARHARAWRSRAREADQALEVARYGQTIDPEAEKEAFRRRQQRDLRRWEAARAQILGELEEIPPGEGEGAGYYDEYEDEVNDDAYGRPRYPGPGSGGVVVDEGKSGWVNADGEQLGDYGVDEDAEFDEPVIVERDSQEELIQIEGDEDVPLAELIRRRKVRTKDGEDT